MKLLKENIREKLGDFGLGSGFLYTTPKAKKKKNGKLDLIKIKKLCFFFFSKNY